MKKLILSIVLAGGLALPLAGSAFAGAGGVPNAGSCGIGNTDIKFDGTKGASSYANANQSNPSNDLPPPSQGYLAGCVGN